MIAEFLDYLYTTKKRRPGTIDGYRAAIADHLKFVSKIDVYNGTHIKNLLKSYHKDCPRVKNPCPKWNLALVLNHLTEAPFEPLAMALPKYLTWKTAFLTLLATGSRCSEVHDLVYSGLKFDEKYRFVTVEPSEEFQAKTERETSKKKDSKEIKIPALSPTLDRGLTEDKTLCPVRALKIYRSRTTDTRKQHDMSKLFISYRKNFDKDICKNTFSGWIRSLIEHAYKNSSNNVIALSNARPHEVRGMAASLAWKANMGLSDIMKACTWKSHTTFTSFYLKDLTMIQDDIRSLGPLVAAQHVVKI